MFNKDISRSLLYFNTNTNTYKYINKKSYAILTVRKPMLFLRLFAVNIKYRWLFYFIVDVENKL